MGSIVFNGSTTITDYNAGVTVNGTAIQEVWFNGTKYWTRYPYPIGTDVFSFSFNPSGTLFDLNAYYAAYPLVFSSAPYISAGNGSGYPDSTMYVPINPGFQVVNVSNGQLGYVGTGTTAGASFSLGMYRTFTCFLGNVASFCGNGGTSFTVRYVGN
jgi:hypothetical protein